MEDTVGALKFTWKIKNYSEVETVDGELYSDVFSLGQYKWQIVAYPNGDTDDNVDHLSIFLEVADSETLPSGWSRKAKFSFTLIDQIDKNSSITKYQEQEFDDEHYYHGWSIPSFVSNDELYDPNKGYLVDNICIIEADVTMYEDASVGSHGSGKLAKEADMETFFSDLNSVMFPKTIVSSEEEAKQALTMIEEALNMTPAEINDPGRMSQLRDAFDVLSSLDDCSMLTLKQKKELVSKKDNFIALSERAAKVVQYRNLFTQKELIKTTLDRKLGRCLVDFEKAKAETNQNEQNIAFLQERVDCLVAQIVEESNKKERSLLRQKQTFELSKELKVELDVLVNNWPVYEAKMKAAEEEEKVVGKEWSKLKQFVSSLKKPFCSSLKPQRTPAKKPVKRKISTRSSCH